MVPYPTRYGEPVPTAELELEPSRLNPEIGRNWSNHHLYFGKRDYQADPILDTLRNLDSSQEMMLRDQHNLGKQALHALYGPPAQPSIKQAMWRLDRAYYDDEKLSIWSKAVGEYVLRDISPEYWNRLNNHYKKYKNR